MMYISVHKYRIFATTWLNFIKQINPNFAIFLIAFSIGLNIVTDHRQCILIKELINLNYIYINKHREIYLRVQPRAKIFLPKFITIEKFDKNFFERMGSTKFLLEIIT